jgi:hypothetical protein
MYIFNLLIKSIKILLFHYVFYVEMCIFHAHIYHQLVASLSIVIDRFTMSLKTVVIQYQWTVCDCESHAALSEQRFFPGLYTLRNKGFSPTDITNPTP